MFNFFKKKAPNSPEDCREIPNGDLKKTDSVDARAQRNDNDITHEAQTRKDVVNLLIPEVTYNQKTGVGAFLQAMAGKRKKNKRKTNRTESVRVSPQKEMRNTLQRSKSEREPRRNEDDAGAKNKPHADDAADFVKALVLQKYAKPHVSLVYVSNEDEKQRTEALLREIARTIDCTVDKINEEKQMGANDSKNESKEPYYETIGETNGNAIDSYRADLKGELQKLTEDSKEDNMPENAADTRSLESPGLLKKSNLKPPRSDAEGCSDDDRSDCGKKKVTFQKHIIFDDGDEQTDEENSFESLSSGEEEEYLEGVAGDDDLLGAYTNEDNKTIINVNERENDGLKRISSDNSDSGFIDGKIDDVSEVKTLTQSDSDSESESEVTDSDEEEIIEIIEEIVETIEPQDKKKSVVSQESRFQSQVAALTELTDARCGETDHTMGVIAAYRKEIEAKDLEIEHLKCELASAYKESELVRQRGRALEEELGAARTCSADLADQLRRKNDEVIRQLRNELEDAVNQRAELESRVLALEKECENLQRQRLVQEQKAQEAIASAEASTAKWRAAHEQARSQAAARAERMLADCEWKMRELEQRARDADRGRRELQETVQQLRENPPAACGVAAELQQLRGVVTEQQRAAQTLGLQLQKVETREEALKLEVHRLKELLDKETRIAKEKEDRHLTTIDRLETEHTKAVDTVRAEHASALAAARAAAERAHAERTRVALAQLRAEADRDVRNADRRLREVTAKFENLKELLATKEKEFERALAEAHSKADWDVMQLRHLLDKSDIAHANNVEKLNEQFEQEKERLNAEWAEKLRVLEEESSAATEEVRKELQTTRMKLIAERVDQVNKLKDKHRQEMEEQWENFMLDKESCLERMKSECRQEGEEERVKREKELLEEIAELKAQLKNTTVDFDNLAVKTAACGRTLAVTEQELREALERERELRVKRAEDATKIKQVERASKDQIEHLTRKCACLRKLFDDMRARLATRDRSTEQETRAKDQELIRLRAEVARLTKLLVQESPTKLGARTRADGCEMVEDTNATRKQHEYRKRPTEPDLPVLAPNKDGRRRSRSIDEILPPVILPVRIKQLEGNPNKK